SFNTNGDPSGNDCFSTACHGVEVWALANPGTRTTSLSGVLVNTNNYILAPMADQPDCTQCLETFDTRISAIPVYHDGLISFALETGVNNGMQTVPAILWGQVNGSITDNGTMTPSTHLQQNGYLSFAGDGSASFGALMPDDEGNLFMVFEFSSSSAAPSSA